MDWLFYLSGAVAVAATLMMLTRLNAVHALLYLIVSLLAVAVVFFVIGAPFVAALEVIVYAGAIMVLFIFVMMLLNLGRRAVDLEKSWMDPGMWVGPVILALILAGEVIYLFWGTGAQGPMAGVISPKQVGLAMYGPYLLGVELASMLLLGGLVGAYHLGYEKRSPTEKLNHDVRAVHTRSDSGGDLVRAGSDRSAGSP
ncbi:MAG TPA: NADH-quinone oxidoreductase subunit J [Terriglobia bacterium]|nr:NADH-quinone oxidoreductase subunit J [Terriglobia bacterium]